MEVGRKTGQGQGQLPGLPPRPSRWITNEPGSALNREVPGECDKFLEWRRFPQRQGRHPPVVLGPGCHLAGSSFGWTPLERRGDPSHSHLQWLCWVPRRLGFPQGWPKPLALRTSFLTLLPFLPPQERTILSSMPLAPKRGRHPRSLCGCCEVMGGKCRCLEKPGVVSPRISVKPTPACKLWQLMGRCGGRV